MSKQHASPEQLEREIAETRAAIDHKLALLQQLAPRRAAAQAVAVLGAQGGIFARNLAITLRDNPVPTVLLAVGIAWLMIAGRNGRHAADGAAADEAAGPESAAAPRTAAALAAVEGSGQGVAAQAARGAEAAEADAEKPAERDDGALGDALGRVAARR